MTIAKKKTDLSGWGNYPRTESFVSNPESDANVAELLREGEWIARGLGRSYADQAVNDQRNVAAMTGLDSLMSFDESTAILECGAGVSLEQIINAYTPKGWLPMICPGTKFVTIGGAIANDIHGKAHHTDGSFVNCVESFRIMLADGRIVNASRTENTDLFWANFGGLGLLGVIVSARIKLRKIETTYFRQKPVVVKDLDHLMAALDEYDEGYNYSVAWIDPLAKGKHLGSGVLTIGNSAKLSELPSKLSLEPLKLHKQSKLSVPFYLPGFALNGLTVRILNAAIRFMQSKPAEFAHYDKFFFPLDIINDWNRGYGRRGFIQYQFVLPVENGKKNLTEIMSMIASSGCVPFLNVFKKMGEGQGILSFPFKGYTLAIDFPMSDRLREFTPKLDAKVLACGGRIYLGKDALLDADTFRKMYPQYKEWMAIKAKYDPNNKFTSNISRRLGLTP